MIKKYLTAQTTRLIIAIVFLSPLFILPLSLQSETLTTINGGWNPIYSPDGTKIAFLSSTLHTREDIWVMSYDGSNPKRLTSSGGYNISWSQDSKYIYFQKKHAGDRVYWRVNVEKNPVEERFITLPEDSTGMVLSPDGNKIAYTTKTGDFMDIYVMNQDGSDKKGLTENFGVRSYQWTSDGKNMFFDVGIVYGVGIFSVNIETTEIKHVFDGYVGNPVYSKEADKLAFAGPMGGKKYQVKVINSDGTGLNTIDAPHCGGLDITWSRDGKSMLYTGPDEKGENALWSLNLSTKKETRIIPKGYEVTSYTFSPDGKTLTFSATTKDTYNTEIWQIKDMDKRTSNKGFFEKLASIFKKSPPPENIIKSNFSQWAAVSSPDGRFVAYISNISPRGVVEIIDLTNNKKITIDTLDLDNNSRIAWLSERGHLCVWDKLSIQFFNFKGETSPIFYKRIFYVDANLQENKILVNAVKNLLEAPKIFLLDVEGINVKKETSLTYIPKADELIYVPAEVQPKWSFKGDKIIFIREHSIWKMDPDGSNREKLISFKSEGEGVQPIISDPAWSIEGDKITFMVSKIIDDNLFSEIWVMNSDGSDAKKLVSHTIDNDFYMYAADFTHPPFFNATGDMIIYTAVSNNKPNIHKIDVTGGKPIELTSEGGIFPALFPDDDILIYTSFLNGSLERLYMMNTDGTEKRAFEVRGE